MVDLVRRELCRGGGQGRLPWRKCGHIWTPVACSPVGWLTGGPLASLSHRWGMHRLGLRFASWGTGASVFSWSLVPGWLSVMGVCPVGAVPVGFSICIVDTFFILEPLVTSGFGSALCIDSYCVCRLASPSVRWGQCPSQSCSSRPRGRLWGHRNSN